MPAQITLGNLTIDTDRYEASIEGVRIGLTYVEFELLCALARSTGRVISRERLMDVWRDSGDDTRRLSVHISRLRRKLAGSDPWRIETVTKRGYILRRGNHRPREPPASRVAGRATGETVDISIRGELR
jgi:DNA-binding response OmpR family regulator